MGKGRKKKKPIKSQLEQRKDDAKCSGKRQWHGQRSSVPKTWDQSKGGRRLIKVIKRSEIPSERLDAMARRISEVTGWDYDWVRSKNSKSIYGMARKHL